MELKDVQANWDRFGLSDPLWAIKTDPTKRWGKWSLEEFFELGQMEIAEVMAHIASLPIELKRERVLDFGCGVGRLTQALCSYFGECHGVDIAPSMIELANQYNRFGRQCTYHLNERADLSLFGDSQFDFIYSNIVLQHMRSDYSKGYLQEFLRILKAGGLLAFQLPSESKTYEPLLDSGFRAYIRCADFPHILKAGAQVTLAVRVKNISDVVWPATWEPGGRYRIQLGNHWLDVQGHIIQNDDGRTPLANDLQPQHEVDMLLPIHAPETSGTYVLELDMVQEGRAWFKEKGSQTLQRCVRVSRDRLEWFDRLHRLIRRTPAPELPERASEPVMEMHAIPKPEVISLLQAAGGKVLDVEHNDDWAGPGWVSYLYWVTR
jgi:SAM-dependent methyltransferase